jgi:hypothetical protein
MHDCSRVQLMKTTAFSLLLASYVYLHVDIRSFRLWMANKINWLHVPVSQRLKFLVHLSGCKFSWNLVHEKRQFEDY